MGIESGFQFSQGCLQDYVDCPRRFQLRYLEHLSWPAIETEPAQEIELYAQKGKLFHHMVYQHHSGVPTDKIEAFIQDDELERWWRNYVVFISNAFPESSFTVSEINLSVELESFRLSAKYDLLVIRKREEYYQIFDWKTTRKRPDREWLKQRLQTRVYRFILASAGNLWNHEKEIDPDRIEIVYWFSNFPSSPMTYAYSHNQFVSDTKYLKELIREISKTEDDGFNLTKDISTCKFCKYRSYCDRGIMAGNLSDSDRYNSEEWEDIELIDFGNLTEIAY